MIIMKVVCPKCKKEGKFSYFYTPDKKGTIAMVSHKTGEYEKVKDCFGNERLIKKINNHFLKQADLDATEWFQKWKQQHDIEDKKWSEEYSKQMDKIHEEEYWKEVEKEYQTKH